jgi:Methyltransferase FkbM domain
MRRALIDLAMRATPRLLKPRFDYHNETANDRWIAECIFPGKQNGYFLEAGASNGEAGSSCYVLEKHLGWTGICVEPHDDFFSKLVATRPNSIHENVCLGGKARVVSFIAGSGDPALLYYSGIRENLMHKSGVPEAIKSGRSIAKQALPLAQILDKHGAPPVIDYGAFDIEGSELEVLAAFPFSRYSFRALSLEWGSSNDPLYPILTAAGYREVRNPFNRTRPWERYFLHRDTR